MDVSRICRKFSPAAVGACVVLSHAMIVAAAGRNAHVPRDSHVPDAVVRLLADVAPRGPASEPMDVRGGDPPRRDIDRAAVARQKQIIAQPVPVPGQPGGGGVLILADRRMIQRIKKAQELVDDGNFGDAATLLQIILDAGEDSFFHPDPEKKTLYRSLKAQAQQIIGDMPAEGLEAYEFQHGPTARAMLGDALTAADADGVAEVSRRFFYTAAGRESMYRLGVLHLDRGRSLAAALCFGQLLGEPEHAAKWEPALSMQAALCWSRAGMPDKAADVLTKLRAKSNHSTVRLGGEEVELFKGGDDPAVWLAGLFGPDDAPRRLGETDWSMFRGNAARNGIVASAEEDALPFHWNSPIATVYDVTRFPTDHAETENDRLLQQTLRNVESTLNQQNRTALPRSQPLIVDGTMYVRTIGNILALDPRDGSRKWESFFDGTVARILGMSENAVPGPNHSRILQMFVSQRVWGDAAYGTMSSDGEFLYAVEGLRLSSVVYVPRRGPDDPYASVQPKATNTLVAYHLTKKGRIGQRAWTLGGAQGDPLYEHPLAGTFFLGPPLPLGGQLYCLVEVTGEIRLIVLDPQRPEEAVWSQPLAGASLPIHQDVRRRLSGTAVSYADGIMVCPTEAGYVIAVDLAHRSLLWGYQFRPAAAQPPQPPAGRTKWLDTAAVLVDGKVLLTPPGSNDVCCLNLLDGSLAWQKTKSDGLYLAGVVDGKVLLVGTTSVQALKLENGTSAWKKAAALPTPSGRGFIRDGRLYLPLSTRQVAVLDVATGTVLARAETPEGVVPGNLLAVGGTIVSQSVDRVDVFPLPKLGEREVAAESTR